MRITYLPDHFAEIHGVEVFRPGIHHGRPYSDADMVKMAANSNRMLPYFRGKLRIGEAVSAGGAEIVNGEPVIKIGHDPANAFLKQAAMGVSARYYVKPVALPSGTTEQRVFADFTNVPEIVAKAIPQFFPERSVEKYRVMPDPFTKEPVEDVIASVAFLGTIPPEVKALSDQYAVLFNEKTDECEQFAFTADEEVVFNGDDEVFNRLSDLVKRAVDQAVLQAFAQTQQGATTMEKKDQVKARYLAGASDEELMKEFEGLTPQELTEWKAEWEKEKAAASDEGKAAEGKAAAKAPDGFSEATNTETVPPKKVSDVAPAKAVTPAVNATVQTFSETQVQDIVSAAVKAQMETFSAKLTEMEAHLNAAKDAARKAEHESLVGWYDTLKANGLPASLDALNPVAFAERLDSQQIETFSEGQPGQTMKDQFKAMLEAFAAVTKITAVPVVSDDMKTGAGKPGRKEMVEKYQAANPDLTLQQIYLKMAQEVPNVFTE